MFLHFLKMTNIALQINGSTGESFTNEEILKMSIPIARALLNKGLCGKIVIVALRNHQCMAAVYYGVLFAGAIPFLIDSKNTKCEDEIYIIIEYSTISFITIKKKIFLNCNEH